MIDLIDRQAAIATAISGRVRTLPTTEEGEDWIRVNEVRDSLLSLPSAQPTADVQEMALENAIDYLNEIGWMQEHDRVLTESAQPDVPERNVGKWEVYYDDDDPQDGIWKCSACRYIRFIDDSSPTNFCPNCGAEMERSEDG